MKSFPDLACGVYRQPRRLLALLLLVALRVAVGHEAWAQRVGNCAASSSQALLDINNVRAGVNANGSLFFEELYEVPKGSGLTSIYEAGFWFGGTIGGELSMIAGGYVGVMDLWSGPVFENTDGSIGPPPDCSDFDRVYKIERDDVVRYDQDGTTTKDLREWPTGLGAPTIDERGREIKLRSDGVLIHVDSTGAEDEEELTFEDRLNRTIDLEKGERPKLEGDQMLWWVMNDLGSTNRTFWWTSHTPGTEVSATAFAFDAPGTLGNIIFFRFRFIYKGSRQIDSAYVSLFVDADIGSSRDDLVGVDTGLGLGYGYNDGVDPVYGSQAPALGVDFLQGPLADPADGIDNDRDGVTDEAGERLRMSSFTRVDRGLNEWNSDPSNLSQFYNLMRGLWTDGSRKTFGGDGHDQSGPPAPFQYPGKPEEPADSYWSEVNIDEEGTSNRGGDRRLLISSGPFTMQRGDDQEVVVGIVWSQGANPLDSVRKLRLDDELAQSLFDIEFKLEAPPSAPELVATPLDRKVVLQWDNPPWSNNYLDTYRKIDRLLTEDVVDDDYVFEGYNVIQYADPVDQVGTLLAVYDVPNGITRVYEGEPVAEMTADGKDSGVRHHHVVEGLTNYQTYYFGVQAYAYNEASGRRVYAGPVSRVEVVPTRVNNTLGGTETNSDLGQIEVAEYYGDFPGGQVSVEIVNPLAVTGHAYEVRFTRAEGPGLPVAAVNYEVRDLDLDESVFIGRSTAGPSGFSVPSGDHVFTVDGLSWTLVPSPPDALDIDGMPHIFGDGDPAFIQVVGLNDSDACGPGAGSIDGCDRLGGNLVYDSFNGLGDWVMSAQGGSGPEASIASFAPNDFEIRVTNEGSYGYYGFTSGNAVWVPLTAWDIGPTGPFGTNDPSDDRQLIPVLFGDPSGEGECRFEFGQTISQDGLGEGWPATDRVYAYYPRLGTDYSDWEAVVRPLVDAAPGRCASPPATDTLAGLMLGFPFRRPLQRLVWAMDPSSPNYRDEMIPVGNVIRFLTTKPFSAGDSFILTTDGMAPKLKNRAAIRLDQIGIVPNPYRGAGDYEISQQADEVRFTNLPERATIRVFDLAGSLVRILEKSSPEAYLRWDLLTDFGLPIASGIYFIHVEVPDVGAHSFKFAVVRKRTQLPIAR